MPLINERRFASGEQLLDELTSDLAGMLRDGLHAGRSASLLVSGGRTPAALFDRLSLLELDWQRVGIGLVDERCVDPASSDSNEHLLRNHLLRNAAAQADFVPMMNDGGTAADRATIAWQALQRLRRPFNAALFGMGEDGHTASWFPGSATLHQALNASAAPNCIGVTPLTAPFERITVNLSAALQTEQLVLLISGERKWEVYQRALEDGPAEDLPVRALLRQRRVPLDVCWSP